jgi:cytochrome c oxidase subunit 1
MEARAYSSAVGLTGTVPKERVAALVRRYIYASTAFLLVAGALGVVMRQSQGDLARLDDSLFYAIMTAHGLGAFVSWAGFAVMGAGLWVLASVDFPMRRIGYLFAEATWWLIVLGTLGIVVSTLVMGFGGSWVFLYPLAFFAAGEWSKHATALFSVSVLLVGVAIITWCLAVLNTVVGPGLRAREGTGLGGRLALALGLGYLSKRRGERLGRPLPYAVLPLSVIGVDMIIATLPLAVLLVEMIVQAYSPGTGVDPLLAKNVLWFFGHPVVYLLLFPAVAVYYLLIPRYAGRELVAGPIVAVAWLIGVVSNVVIWAHHVYLDYPEDTIQAQLNLAMQPLTFTITLVSALSLYSLSATIYRARFEWTPAASFLVAGMVGWLTAGLSGVVNATIQLDEAVHNTLWVVGHFHHMALLNIGLVAFAAVYAFLPDLTGKRWYSERLGHLHLWLTLIGGYGMVVPWLIQGLTGAPRRFAVLPEAYDATTYIALPFIGLIVLGQLTFIWNLSQTLRGRLRASDSQVASRQDYGRLAWASFALLWLAFIPATIWAAFRLEDQDAQEAAHRSNPARETQGASAGAQLFSSTCGSCHTLSGAGTSGTIGPNLDDLAPDTAQVAQAIERGGAGSGGMPANLLTGADAQTVADFVARNAGP